MAAKTGRKAARTASPRQESGVYIDSSALAKVYMPEPESDVLEQFLLGRRDLMISELCCTEVISAVARRRREGALEANEANTICRSILADAKSGSLRRLDLSPAIHRDAESMLLTADTVPLRTLDALHIALALSGRASQIVTFDKRLAHAAALHGFEIVQLGRPPQAKTANPG